MNGSTLLARELTKDCDVIARHINLDNDLMKQAISTLNQRKVFTHWFKASSNNRGSDTYTTGMLKERTQSLINDIPFFRELMEIIAPPGNCSVTNTWLTNSCPLNENNPNGGHHESHGDGNYKPADARVLNMLGDSDRGKLVTFQNVETGVWVQIAVPSGTMLVLSPYGGGVGDSPIQHAVSYGDETYTFIIEIKINRDLLGNSDADDLSDSNDCNMEYNQSEDSSLCALCSEADELALNSCPGCNRKACTTCMFECNECTSAELLCDDCNEANEGLCFRCNPKA